MKFPAFDPIDLTNNSGHFSISDLKVENIVADPNQPRKKFNEASIGELSASIKLHGIIQPIIVRQIGSQKYQIIAGERRWRAACLAGVNVVLKGTTTGTVTNVSGHYSIVVPSQGGALIFSFIGLQTKEVSIGKLNVLNVTMTLDVSQLSELVVTGYARESKRARRQEASFEGLLG